jgi:hypothetical protein
MVRGQGRIVDLTPRRSLSSLARVVFVAAICLSAYGVVEQARAYPSPEGRAEVTCERALILYERRVKSQDTASFPEDEWGSFLDGYNACVDAGKVSKEMEAAVEWAVECAEVAGVNPECPTSKKNPSIPPPTPEPKEPLVSPSAPQQTQASRPQEPLTSTKTEYSPPGFWMGGWHGLVWPWRFTASFFTNTDVWADDNVGILYAIGYILGLILCIPVWVGVVIGIFNRES